VGLSELGNGVLEVREAAWLHAQGVYLYAQQPGPDGDARRARAVRLELIAHLAEFQADIGRQRSKMSDRDRRSTAKR
jgi:hypothetical protein